MTAAGNARGLICRKLRPRGADRCTILPVVLVPSELDLAGNRPVHGGPGTAIGMDQLVKRFHRSPVTNEDGFSRRLSQSILTECLIHDHCREAGLTQEVNELKAEGSCRWAGLP